MSISITSAVWRLPLKSSSMRLVILRLADHADSEGVAWPSVQNLAEMTGLSVRTVIRALGSLRDEGLIEIQPNKSPHNRRSNRYQIRLAKLRTFGQLDGKGATLRPSSGANLTCISVASGATLSSPQVTVQSVSSDKRDIPPAPPISKNHQEPSHTPAMEVINQAVRMIGQSEGSLRNYPITRALAGVIQSELRKDVSLDELVERLPAQWRLFVRNRNEGRFGISGWKAENFFADGHWCEEQSWPWKAEFRPRSKLRWIDPETIYDGPEYQSRVVNA